MLGSSLALATGLVLLLVARLSGRPTELGVVVFAGYLAIGLACGLHLGAVVALADRLAAPWQAAAAVLAWVAGVIGALILIGRAPGDEVLAGFALTPLAVGILGVLVMRDARGAALTFLGFASALALFLGSVWLSRLGN